jgi:pantoate--beta-alanine ligase
MKIVKSISVLRKVVCSLKRRGKTIGFVPTMGFLHEGHLSLVRRAKKENDVVVVSIYINPAQFGPKEDFKNYPRDLRRDTRLLRGLCDLLFIPSVKEMVAQESRTFIEVRRLSDLLCGRTRKGHFSGVATVVAKLFNIVAPDAAYFGQKDAQQAVVLEQMAADLNFSAKMVVMPVVREKNGLAMSSRNVYLSDKEKAEAVVLFQALKSAEHMVAAGSRDTKKIIRTLYDFISRTPSARIDYIEIVDKKTLESVSTIKREALLLLAVHVGSTRLIDNTILKVK